MHNSKFQFFSLAELSVSFLHKAPVMAERFVSEEDELFELSFPRYLSDLFWPRTPMYDADDDDDDEDEEEFVFNIDQSLLVDPRRVLFEKMIGEGSYSIVYKGLWVSSSSFFLLAFLILFHDHQVHELITLCACMFLNFHASLLCPLDCFVYSFVFDLKLILVLKMWVFLPMLNPLRV